MAALQAGPFSFEGPLAARGNPFGQREMLPESNVGRGEGCERATSAEVPAGREWGNGTIPAASYRLNAMFNLQARGRFRWESVPTPS